LIVFAAAVAGLTSPVARAQEQTRPFDVEPFVGAYVPTGDQRDLLDDAVAVGLTASYDVHRHVAILGSFSWAPTKVKGLATDDDLDLFQYDVGVEGHYPFALGGGWAVRPFLGLGAGARTYSFRDLDVDAETDFAGYVSAGISAQRGPLSVRLIARDYVTAFDGLAGGGDDEARNDVSIFAGVGMRF
jgi:hypothetical protein